MKIKILGKNSSNRTKIIKNVNRAIKEIDGSFEVLLLEENEDFIKYGITNTPSIVIDEKVISQGRILSDREIINYIRVLS